MESGSEIGYDFNGSEMLKPSMSLSGTDGNIVLVPGWQQPLFHARVQQDTRYGSLKNILWIHQHLAKTKIFWMDFFLLFRFPNRFGNLKKFSVEKDL